MQTNNQGECVIKACHRPAAPDPRYRGLCLPCYSIAKGAVTRGETTWAELMALGLARPMGDDPFTRALKEARNEQPSG